MRVPVSQLPLDAALLTVVIQLIDFAGSLVIVGFVLAALLALARLRVIERARLLIAEGALWGLSFKVAATLLKTITLTNWQAVAFFVVIFALRTLLKRAFSWERMMILQRISTAEQPAGRGDAPPL